MNRARTYRYTRMRRGVERSNDTEALPLRPFYRGCIIATRGYNSERTGACGYIGLKVLRELSVLPCHAFWILWEKFDSYEPQTPQALRRLLASLAATLAVLLFRPRYCLTDRGI
jgi:hypothetical protein